MASNPVVELWDVGGGSMIIDSRHVFYDLSAACFCNTLARHVFYDRDYHGVVLVYDATNPKSKQSIARWSQEFLSFRSRSNPVQRQYVSSFPQCIFVTFCACTLSFTSRTKRIALQRTRGGSWRSRVSKAASYGTWRRRPVLRMPTVLQSPPSSAL
jgi:hypothetical protein